MDITSQLKEILNNITEESQIASIKRAETDGLDLNRGLIPLSESYYNLNEIKDQLSDAIEKKKLNQIPLSIQQKFHKDLNAVAKRILDLTNGSDEIVNIANDIESIYVDLYHSRLSTISDEHLGYDKKMNQLKYLITEAKNLQKELKAGLEQKIKVEELATEIETKTNEIEIVLSDMKAKNDSATDINIKIIETQTQVNTHYAEIAANEKIVKDLLAEVRSSDSIIKKIEVDSKKFADEIDSYQETIENVSEDAKKAVTKNTKDTEDLIFNLQELENQIKDQIQKATGYSLFTSFQTRQENISRNKSKWLLYIGVLIALSIGLAGFIGFTHSTHDLAFYLKLSISLPLIFAISFCTVQYSRERKLEEEYAFKSNISISLVPYKELIEKLSTTDEQKQRYTTFLIESISRVFTSPTEKVFGGDEHITGPEQALKNLTNTMEAIMKPIEPVLKALNKK